VFHFVNNKERVEDKWNFENPYEIIMTQEAIISRTSTGNSNMYPD